MGTEVEARATERSGSPGLRTGRRELQGAGDAAGLMGHAGRRTQLGEGAEAGLAGGLLDGREEGDIRRRLAGRQQRNCTALRRTRGLGVG